jgi:hypothetical protein
MESCFSIATSEAATLSPCLATLDREKPAPPDTKARLAEEDWRALPPGPSRLLAHHPVSRNRFPLQPTCFRSRGDARSSHKAGVVHDVVLLNSLRSTLVAFQLESTDESARDQRGKAVERRLRHSAPPSGEKRRNAAWLDGLAS